MQVLLHIIKKCELAQMLNQTEFGVLAPWLNGCVEYRSKEGGGWEGTTQVMSACESSGIKCVQWPAFEMHKSRAQSGLYALCVVKVLRVEGQWKVRIPERNDLWLLAEEVDWQTGPDYCS